MRALCCCAAKARKRSHCCWGSCTGCVCVLGRIFRQRGSPHCGYNCAFGLKRPFLSSPEAPLLLLLVQDLVFHVQWKPWAFKIIFLRPLTWADYVLGNCGGQARCQSRKSNFLMWCFYIKRANLVSCNMWIMGLACDVKNFQPPHK